MWNGFKALAVAAGVVAAGVSGAQADFPDKQITMIVPFGAGGGSDRVARMVDQFWQEETGTGFNFKYQPGAAGAVGTSAIARATPDGYTIGIVNLPNMVVQPVSGAASFALDDFDYIGRVNADPIVLMVPEDSPYQTLDDFIAAAKEQPGTLTVAITGTLGAAHLVLLQLMEDAQIEVTMVPTQGGANALARIAGGHVSAGLIGLGLYTNQENGRALAVTAAERSDFAPDVPTFAENGVDLDLSTSRIIVAPAGVPEEALSVLRGTLAKVVEGDGFKTASKDQGQGAVWEDGADLEASVMKMEGNIRRVLESHDLIQ